MGDVATAREKSPVQIDISNNPRLSQLLGRIEEIRRALLKLPPNATERTKYEHALAGFYIEVGKYVHWLMRQEPATLERIDAEARRWAAETDAFLAGRTERRRTRDTPMLEATIDSHSHELSGPDEVSIADWTGESSAVAAQVAEIEAEIEPMDLQEIEPDAIIDEGTMGSTDALPLEEARELAGFEHGDQAAIEVASAPVEVAELVELEVEEVSALIRDGSSPWANELLAVLETLGPPATSYDDDELCEREKRRVVNATTNMEMRWVVLPDEVQHALLCAVASRARAVQSRLAVDVELRLALGRMRRFREARGLEEVPALHAEPVPERASWFADASFWWRRLKG